MKRRGFLASLPALAAFVGLRPRATRAETCGYIETLTDDGTFAQPIYGVTSTANFDEELQRVYARDRLFEMFERDDIFYRTLR